MTLVALAPSPLTTVQDMGRQGWRRFGLTGAGAMDVEALAAANALAGNEIDTAAIEFAHAGGEWTIEGEPRLAAIAGGSFDITLDGRPVPAYAAIQLRPGQVLHIGGARDAVWGYLALAGGLAVPRQYGSRSTHLRTGIGGLDGRMLQPGDLVPLGRPSPAGTRHLLPIPRAPVAPIRVVLGPQETMFTQAALRTFLSAEFTVSFQTDRTGYRLEGPPIEHEAGFDIVSDGLMPGSIQVPGTRQPIVLLRDVQTTGGFPKIATVISADLGRFAQLRPRAAVRFQQVGLDDAQLLRREFVYRLQATRLRLMTTAPT